MEDIVNCAGEVRQELRRAIQLTRQRVRRAGRDPDLITVIKNRFDVPSLLAVLLDRTFAFAQRAAHGAVQILLIPHHPEARLPRADPPACCLQSLMAHRPLPLGVIDHPVHDWLLPGVRNDEGGMPVLRLRCHCGSAQSE
jgi:hypothetical protein